MTTYFPFTPSRIAPPQFRPTFDGDIYLCTVTWSLFGKRYYVNCYDQASARIFTMPLIETLTGINIITMSWDVETHLVTASCAQAHGLKVGTIVNLTLNGCLPTTYNGAYACNVVSPTDFTYTLTDDPGSSVAPGTADYVISITAGYFSSTLIFRNGRFEVNP